MMFGAQFGFENVVVCAKIFDLKYVIVSLEQEFRLGFKIWKLANRKFLSLLACKVTKPDHIPIPVLKKSLYTVINPESIKSRTILPCKESTASQK